MTNQKNRSARADVYERITAEIAVAIQAGASGDDYRMPWHHDGTSITRPANFASKRRYRGVNTLALWLAADARGYREGLWGTYKQWAAAGAQVRKAEKAATVVFWKEVSRSSEAAGGDDDGGYKRMFARAFSVFNVAQVEGYASPPPASVLGEEERLTHAEAFVANLGVATEFGGDEAYYRPSTDTIVMPSFARFRDAATFYGVWLHENGHASGAKHRLDRDLSGRFGSASYAFEELIVEFASAMVLADLGIACHPRPDHAAYIASWLGLLEAEPRALFTAASKAQQVADWMHARQPQTAEADIQTSEPAELAA